MDPRQLDEQLNATKRKNVLRKSVSTIGFASGYANVSLREARSFTGALEELRTNTKSNNPCQVSKLLNIKYLL